MKLKKLLIVLLITISLGVTAQTQRPTPSDEDNVQREVNYISVPTNMMVNIMAGPNSNGRKANRKNVDTNDCGNIGITPADLQQYEQTSTFIVNLSGFTPEAEQAFQHAIDIWSRVITAEVPIEINASFTSLAPGILGTAGPSFLFRNLPGEPIANTFYPSALADQLFGADQAGTDIIASFSSNFTNWYFGLDGCPAQDEFDFVTLVLHEIAHGLGIIGTAEVLFFSSLNESLGCYGFSVPNTMNFLPTIFDQFVESGDGIAVTDFDPDFCWVELRDIFTGDNLVFNGANAIACNSGAPPRLFAPSLFDVGSSFSHFDEDIFPTGSANSLLTPFFSPGEAIHDPNCSLAVLRDLGFNAHGFIRMIPTLGQWSIIILFLLLPIFSVVVIKHQLGRYNS